MKYSLQLPNLDHDSFEFDGLDRFEDFIKEIWGDGATLTKVMDSGIMVKVNGMEVNP